MIVLPMKRIIYITLLLGFACAPAYARDIGFMGVGTRHDP